MGPSPARSGKHEDMLRLMLSLESIASIVSEKEETADEVADEWEERFAVWQAQLKDLSRLLHETSSQLEAETQRADIAETTLRVSI